MAAQKAPSYDELKKISKKIRDYLNGNLTQINTNLDNGIIDNNMDPWGQAAYGSQTFTDIDLGVCRAESNGNFAVQNLTGLSTLNISDFEEVAVLSPPSYGYDMYHGDGQCKGTIGPMSADLNGYVRAHCGVIGAHVNPTGFISIGGIAFTMDFEVNVSGTPEPSDNEFCINSLNVAGIEEFDLVGNIDVQIDGLGIFQSLLEPIINWVINNLLKSVLEGAIIMAILNSMNQELNSNLPTCITTGSDATKPN